MEKSIITVLRTHIQELGNEARMLVERRENIHNELHNIDIRLTHITGAIAEMNKIVMKRETNEAKNSSKPTVNESIPEADDVQPADDNSLQDQEDSSDIGCGVKELPQPPEGFAG